MCWSSDALLEFALNLFIVPESGGEENNTATDFARHWAVVHIAQVLIDEADEYVILFESPHRFLTGDKTHLLGSATHTIIILP